MADSARVDPFVLAAQHGVRVRLKAMSATFWGATLPGARVVINSALPPRRQRFTMAHEFGHILSDLGEAPWVATRTAEGFADRFARELLAPIEQLRRLHPAQVDVACSVFDVEDRVILSQLTAAKLVPSGVRTEDGAVVCEACGDIQRTPGCACGVQRWT